MPKYQYQTQQRPCIYTKHTHININTKHSKDQAYTPSIHIMYQICLLTSHIALSTKSMYTIKVLFNGYTISHTTVHLYLQLIRWWIKYIDYWLEKNYKNYKSKFYCLWIYSRIPSWLNSCTLNGDSMYLFTMTENHRAILRTTFFWELDLALYTWAILAV